ncbi:Lar family restriction alleviation protein [Alcaligenes nematophilus]
MSTETRLKPCPFCGGAAKEFERFNANVITCRRCGVKVRQSEMGEGDAAVRWNQRATPVAAQAQQPVSGADGLPQGWRMVPEKIPMKGLDDAIGWMRCAMNQAGRDLAYCLTGAWSILLDSVTPPDHLPDATKTVEPSGDDHRNAVLEEAAQELMRRRALLSGQNVALNIQEGLAMYDICIDAIRGLKNGDTQPSWNAGELPAVELPPLTKPEAPANTVGLEWHAHTNIQMLSYGRTCAEAQRKADQAALAQQDADRVDAEQWASVNEHLPEIHEWWAGSIAGISDAVLTIDEDDPDTMTVQRLRKGGQGDLTTLYWDNGDSPTHWRPAPPLPGIDAAHKEKDV